MVGSTLHRCIEAPWRLRMELRRLKYMSVLEEELHFGKAAERLGIAQPALTQHIQALERELDVELFQRTKRSVKLTVAGRVTLNEAIRTLQQAEKTALVARQAGRGELGHIEIGYVGSAIFTGVLSKAISRFRQENPLVEFRLNEIGIVQQLDDVSSGRLDLGILRLALKSQPFVAVQIQEGSGFNAQVAKICAAGGLSPQITQRAGQFTALAVLVAGGLGVAFVHDSLRHLQIADVVYRPLAKINQHSDLAMVYRKLERAPAVIAFVDQLRRSARPAA